MKKKEQEEDQEEDDDMQDDDDDDWMRGWMKEYIDAWFETNGKSIKLISNHHQIKQT